MTRGLAIAAACLALGAAHAFAPAAQAAETTGIALVIGDDHYAGRVRNTDCVRTAHAVGGRLSRQGFTVEMLLDPSAVALRSTLDSLAEQLGGVPSGTTLIYVCAGAIAEGSRIFVIPSDVDIAGPVEPETQGVVLPAFLNALAGTGGTLYADLGLRSGRIASPLGTQRVPDGLHLALATSSNHASAALGRALADQATLTGNWASIVQGMKSAIHPGDHVADLFVPSGLAPVASTMPAVPRTPPAIPIAPPPSALPPPPAERPPVAEASRPAPAREARSRHHGGSRDTRTGPVSPRIARIQVALARHGVYSGPIDGQMTGRATAAIRAFQTSLGDPASGVLTQIEIVHLLNS